MVCKHCGNEIEDGSIFCSKCGKSQVGDRESHKQGKKRIKPVLISMVGIVIVIVTVVVLISRSMTAVDIVNTSVEAGSIVNTKDIITAKSDSASVTIDGEIDTSQLGMYEISYNVSNGIFHLNKTILISIVDTTSPIIAGPEKLTMIAGQEFIPGDYYTVTDFEKNLAGNIVITPEIDTEKEGMQNVTLSVTDSSGNKGDLQVEVYVLNLTTNEEKVLQAINQYIADGNSKNDILESAWVMKTSGGSNGVDYYVEVADNVLYAIYDSGTVSEFTVTDCGGTTMHELMVYAVHYDGTIVNTSKLLH